MLILGPPAISSYRLYARKKGMLMEPGARQLQAGREGANPAGSRQDRWQDGQKGRIGPLPGTFRQEREPYRQSERSSALCLRSFPCQPIPVSRGGLCAQRGEQDRAALLHHTWPSHTRLQLARAGGHSRTLCRPLLKIRPAGAIKHTEGCPACAVARPALAAEI
jgi:hypothetical protein